MTGAYAVRMRRLLIAGLLLLAAVPTASAAPAPSILFSVDSRNAVVSKPSGYRVSLNANARVTWFSDRPARQAGTTTLAGLVGTWTANGFAADPPNAALILRGDNGLSEHVVVLRSPVVANGRVTFAIRAVPGGNVSGHGHANALAVGTYRAATLFIDDAAYPPCRTVAAAYVLTCVMAPGQTVMAMAFGGGHAQFCLPVPGLASITGPGYLEVDTPCSSAGPLPTVALPFGPLVSLTADSPTQTSVVMRLVGSISAS